MDLEGEKNSHDSCSGDNRKHEICQERKTGKDAIVRDARTLLGQDAGETAVTHSEIWKIKAF